MLASSWMAAQLMLLESCSAPQSYLVSRLHIYCTWPNIHLEALLQSCGSGPMACSNSKLTYKKLQISQDSLGRGLAHCKGSKGHTLDQEPDGSRSIHHTYNFLIWGGKYLAALQIMHSVQVFWNFYHKNLLPDFVKQNSYFHVAF
jgi:hypothetical protein